MVNNLELIAKYNKTFLWFMANKNKGVLIKQDHNGWEAGGPSAFNWPVPEMIIDIMRNDEFVDLKLAYEKGKTVEYNEGHGWKPIKEPAWLYARSSYRIKHDWEKLISKDNPVICRVWDNNRDSALTRQVIGYNERKECKYKSDNGLSWEHAEPITTLDLLDFQRVDVKGDTDE